jgi:hypothetical protein
VILPEGQAPPSWPSPRDLDAMAAVLAHVEHVPIAEARLRIVEALRRGEKHVVLLDPCAPSAAELRGEHP